MWAQRQSTKDEGHGKMEAGNYIDAATGKEWQGLSATTRSKEKYVD
jgi:hypothetical protein